MSKHYDKVFQKNKSRTKYVKIAKDKQIILTDFFHKVNVYFYMAIEEIFNKKKYFS